MNFNSVGIEVNIIAMFINQIMIIGSGSRIGNSTRGDRERGNW